MPWLRTRDCARQGASSRAAGARLGAQGAQGEGHEGKEEREGKGGAALDLYFDKKATTIHGHATGELAEGGAPGGTVVG